MKNAFRVPWSAASARRETCPIVLIRRAAGITQTELGRRIGMVPQVVHGYEGRDVRVSTLLRCARAAVSEEQFVEICRALYRQR